MTTEWAVVMTVHVRLPDGCVLEHREEGGPAFTLSDAGRRCEDWLKLATNWHDTEYEHLPKDDQAA